MPFELGEVPANHQVFDSSNRLYADSSSERVSNETESDRSRLMDEIDSLRKSGKDPYYVENLLNEFSAHDKDGDQKISKKELEEFFRKEFWKDAQDFQTLTEEDFSNHVKKVSQRAEGVASSGLGGKNTAEIAVELLRHAQREKQVAEDSQYSSRLTNRNGFVTREEFLACAREGMENVVRARMDDGIKPDALRDLNAAVDSFRDERGDSFISNEFHAAMKKAAANPQEFDSNSDGLVDTKAIVTHLIKSGLPQPLEINSKALQWMKEVLMFQTPNPESAFIERLNYRFETYDLDRNGRISPAESNKFFKENLWDTMDSRQVDRSQVDWAWESADSFWLCGIGGEDSAELARATMAGVRDNFSKYNHPYKFDDGEEFPKPYLEEEEYKEALRSELTTALLQRLNQGISHNALKDYAEISESFKSHFKVEEPGFNRLESALRRAASAPELVDRNQDGRISAEELWSYAGH